MNDPSLLDMAWHALTIVGDPSRLLYLCFGVLIGLVLGVIPGLGGLIGLSLLLPFTYNLDPYTALAMLIGLSAVTATSDTIPAVLFSVPGTVGCAATVLDGYPMARKGEAGRALGAAFSASIFGGLFGALLLALSIPILRPLVLMVGSPELFGICVLGLAMVAALTGRTALKGMVGVSLGLLLAMVGEDSQTATLRWTFDTIYLWDGVPLIPFALGLFALPELADLAISRKTIASGATVMTGRSQLAGVADVRRNWWLVLRCSGIGSLLGAVPGMGAAVIDWIAYGHAARTEKDAARTFGTGDVRGVIASESSNNAKEGGALIPTIAFGVPGSASMALLLGAFLVHNVVPGPDMLTTKLDVTYTLIWSLALANLIGGGICFLFANQLAKIAVVRIAILVPLVLAMVYVGVYQTSSSWGDLGAFLAFGALGWVMKRLDWPRPPVILGFVLGALIERYMFISVQRYDYEWLAFPLVLAFLALAVLTLARPILSHLRHQRASAVALGPVDEGGPARADIAFTALAAGLFLTAIVTAWQWDFGAWLVPTVVAAAGLLFALLQLAGKAVARAQRRAPPRAAESQTSGEPDIAHAADDLVGDLGWSTVLSRAAMFALWCLGFLAAIRVVGMLPAMLLFVLAYARFMGKERWLTASVVAVVAVVASYFIFQTALNVPWPGSLLGDLMPELRSSTVFGVL